MKNLTLSTLARLLPLACGRRSARRLAILIYHRVLASGDFMRSDVVDEARFEWHMELLRSFFNPLSLAAALDLLKTGDLPPASVCVTFDDGYADNVEVALPILKKWDIPATFFISSGYLDGGRMWNDTILESFRQLEAKDIDLSSIGMGVQPLATENARRDTAQRVIDALKHRPPEQRSAGTRFIASMASELPDDLMMSGAQVKKLVDAGMEIGGHTVSHPILAALDREEARREILDGKNALEKLTGKSVSFFAYPNGKPGRDYTDFHRRILPGLGFKAAVSTHWGVSTVGSDIWQLPRFTPWDKNPAQFMLRMIRNYQDVQ
ncbi:MAG: polysaccharide deacetylase family protein [Methylococcaceae bacterium]|nr:polysaccharide deacetylase family protein [Methylococcaceae bacterium]MCI0668424.1 polysaccharide deacetylase family protein [Methylococcaceae bacterium]MCI0734224.1 polysaccharide deacetylase family protein [Methylococcaceae bacterium]